MANPGDLDALWQASLAQQSRADWVGARRSLSTLLELSPGHPETLSALAIVALRLDEPDNALALAQDACQRERRHPGLLVNLGLVQETRGELDAASATYRKALRLEPRLVEAHLNLGNTLLKRGDSAAAIVALRRAEALCPRQPAVLSGVHSGVRSGVLTEVLTALGNALAEAKRPDEARSTYERALAVDPCAHDALIGLGTLHADAGRPAEARAVYTRLLALAPDDAETLLALGAVALMLGDYDTARARLRAALDARPAFDRARTNYLAALNFDDSMTPATLYAETLAVARDIEADGAAHRVAGATVGQLTRTDTCALEPGAVGSAPQTAAGTDRRIRIGFVSGDLGQHSVSHFVWPLFQHIDRARFEVFAYPTLQRIDPVASRLRGEVEHWYPIDALDDDQAAQRIHSDRIDLLVDLAGHTRGERLRVFARRPAPVQLAWCGYPGTTGLSTIDWRLTDAIADPPGEADRFHSERLLRLPGCFLCYQPPPDAPPPARHARGPGIVFGSFNNAAKLSDATLRAWSAVLDAVPGSRLLIKAPNLQHREVAAALLARCTRAGIDVARVEFEPPLASITDHLARYGAIDIALDTLPYNGTTTTCEALWMGVPVTTLAGDRHAARVGASLLDAAGVGEWVAYDLPQFVALVTLLAADTDRLRLLRDELRQRLRTSPLLDAPSFARRFSAAVETMLAGIPPGG